MTTSITDPPRVRGPLTERILQIASRKRMFQRTVAQLAGITEAVWSYRVKTDQWQYGELCDIATALNERVDVLLDVNGPLP